MRSDPPGTPLRPSPAASGPPPLKRGATGFALFRLPLLLATVVGLAAALWAFGRTGWRDVVASATRVGPGGFALLCLISLATFVVLGGSWLVAARGVPRGRLGRFVWGRMTREAANDLLPFSQLGGVVIGVQTVVAAGVPRVPAFAATIVDMSTEMAAQLLFTLFALWAVGTALGGGQAALGPTLWVGLGVATALALAFFLLQRPALALAGALVGRVVPGAGALAAQVGEELRAVYAAHGRVALSFLLNLLAWGMTAWWSWIALRLTGAPTQLWSAAALESAIFALRSAAFVVPGALGVQEAGYALLAPVLGIDPRAALALSLVKRARDVAIGLPTLLAWQAGELRARPLSPAAPGE